MLAGERQSGRISRAPHGENALHGPPRSGRGARTHTRFPCSVWDAASASADITVPPNTAAPLAPRALWGWLRPAQFLPPLPPSFLHSAVFTGRPSTSTVRVTTGTAAFTAVASAVGAKATTVILALEAAAPGRRGSIGGRQAPPNPCDPLPSDAAAPSRA